METVFVSQGESPQVWFNSLSHTPILPTPLRTSAPSAHRVDLSWRALLWFTRVYQVASSQSPAGLPSAFVRKHWPSAEFQHRWCEASSKILLLLVLEQNLECYPHCTAAAEDKRCPNGSAEVNSYLLRPIHPPVQSMVFSSGAPQLQWVNGKRWATGGSLFWPQTFPMAAMENAWMWGIKCIWYFKRLTLPATRISRSRKEMKQYNWRLVKPPRGLTAI